MVIFKIFKIQNLIKIYTKLHHFKKISRGHAPEPPYQSDMQISKSEKKILGPPPPSKSWERP